MFNPHQIRYRCLEKLETSGFLPQKFTFDGFLSLEPGYTVPLEYGPCVPRSSLGLSAHHTQHSDGCLLLQLPRWGEHTCTHGHTVLDSSALQLSAPILTTATLPLISLYTNSQLANTLQRQNVFTTSLLVMPWRKNMCPRSCKPQGIHTV